MIARKQENNTRAADVMTDNYNNSELFVHYKVM